MKKTIQIYEGRVERNIYGSWSDVEQGVYIDHDEVSQLISEYEGKRIRITLEVLPNITDGDS